MPTKLGEDADGNKFYASFGVPISQVHVKIDPDRMVIPSTELPQFWPDYLRFESEPITFEAKLEGDFSGLIRHCMNQTYETNTKEKTKMKMEMSEKMAVRLHRMMWTDMLEELGDNPAPAARVRFKVTWIEENFPGASIECSCFLCEYAWQKSKETNSGKPCRTYCPIMWNAKSPGAHNSCSNYNNTGISYDLSPISEILALPARNPEYDEKDSSSDYFRGYRRCLDDLARTIGDPSGTFKTATDAYTRIYNKGKGEAHISKDAFDGMKRALAEASGKPENATISEHIEGIRTKSSGPLEAYYWKSCYEGVLRKLYSKADILIPFDLSKVKTEDADWIITRLIYKSVDKGRTEGFEKAAKQMADELDKAFNKGRSSAYDAICKRAGVMGVGVNEIIEAIRKQGVDNFLDEHPQAKYWTEDNVDQAFRTYAAEQVRPFLDKLSKESGLRRDLDVGVHVEAIKKMSYAEGYDTGCSDSRKACATRSGLSIDTNIRLHLERIHEKAYTEGRKDIAEKLAEESGLNTLHCVDLHIAAIKKKAYDRGFENGNEKGTKETMDKIMNAFKK